MRSRAIFAGLALTSTVVAAFSCGTPFDDSAAPSCDGGRCQSLDATALGVGADGATPPDLTDVDAMAADAMTADDGDAGAEGLSDGSSHDASDAAPCGPGTYCATVLATKPLAYFRFEEAQPVGGGLLPLVDWSGNHWSGALMSPYALGAAPAPVDPAGHAAHLTGGGVAITPAVDAGVDLSFPSGKSFSISGWFDLDTVDGGPNGWFGGKTVSSSSLQGYFVYVGNFLGFEARDGISLFSYIHAPATNMPTGGYAHVAFTWDGTTPAMYIRGGAVTEGVSARTRPFATLPASSPPFQLTLTAGSVDEYAIYDRVLTAGEIATLSQSGM